jgi:hypothetical protein
MARLNIAKLVRLAGSIYVQYLQRTSLHNVDRGCQGSA